MSLQLPIPPMPTNTMEHDAQHGNDDGYNPVAGPSTHALQALTAGLGQLTITPPAPATPSTPKRPKAPAKQYHVHASPQRQSSGNRFWVVGDVTRATTEYTDTGTPPPANGEATTPPRRPPALSVLTATEFAELRTTLQRAYLPGMGGEVAKHIAQLAHFTESGRHAARWVSVRVPPCVANDGPVVLGRAVAHIGAQTLAVFCLVLPPLSRRRVPGPSEIAKVTHWVKDDESGSLSSVFLHLAMAHGVSVRPLRPAPSAHGIALLSGLEAHRNEWDGAVETLVLAEYFAAGVQDAIGAHFRPAERTHKNGRKVKTGAEAPSSQQLCRVLGYLDRLVSSNIKFDPPQAALGVVKATLATCIPPAVAEEAERASWMAWAGERNIRTMIIGWAFADAAHWVLLWDMAQPLPTAIWQLLSPDTQLAANTFTHLALGVSGMCTRSMMGRDGKKWFVTLLPGLESHRGRRVPGEVGRPLPPKVVAARLAAQLQSEAQAVEGPSTQAPKPRRRRVRPIAKKVDLAPEKQLGEGSEAAPGPNKPEAATTTSTTAEIDQAAPSVTDAVNANQTIDHETMLEDDKNNEADDEDEQDDERTLIDEADQGGMQLEPVAAAPPNPPQTPYNAGIDDAQPVSRPGSSASSDLGSPRPLSPLTDLSEISSDESESRPLALMRRLNSSAPPSSPRSVSSADVPLAYFRRRSSSTRIGERSAGGYDDAALSADHEASDHSATSSILSSTTSSPSSYGLPDKNEGELSGMDESSSREDVPLSVMRRRTVTAESSIVPNSSSPDVPLAKMRQRAVSADRKNEDPVYAPPKQPYFASKPNKPKKRRNLGSTSDDEPLTLVQALQNRLSLADDDMGQVQSSDISPLGKKRVSSANYIANKQPLSVPGARSRAVASKRAEEKPVQATQPRKTRRRMGATAKLRTQFDMDTSSDEPKVPLSVALRRRYSHSSSEDEALPIGQARKRSMSSSSGENEKLSTQLTRWRKKQRRGKLEA